MQASPSFVTKGQKASSKENTFEQVCRQANGTIDPKMGRTYFSIWCNICTALPALAVRLRSIRLIEKRADIAYSYIFTRGADLRVI